MYIMYMRVCVHVYRCIDVYVCMYVCMCIHIYIYIHIHIYTYIYTYMYIYMYIYREAMGNGDDNNHKSLSSRRQTSGTSASEWLTSLLKQAVARPWTVEKFNTLVLHVPV